MLKLLLYYKIQSNLPFRFTGTFDRNSVKFNVKINFWTRSHENISSVYFALKIWTIKSTDYSHFIKVKISSSSLPPFRLTQKKHNQWFENEKIEDLIVSTDYRKIWLPNEVKISELTSYSWWEFLVYIKEINGNSKILMFHEDCMFPVTL